MDKVSELAAMIDHSILHPTATDADLREGCALAAGYGTATVCVKPYAVAMAAGLLEGSGVKVCTVAGFPHGSSATAVKVAECRQAYLDGALEVDMVVNIGKVLGGDWTYVAGEVRALNTEVRAQGAILKVIFENDFLTDEHKIELCRICSEAEVAFVKTSTGYGYVKGADGRFSTRGATLADLRLMRSHCPPGVGVKAAGGVRTLDEMLLAVEAGANRIGATATAVILEAARARFGGGPAFTGQAGGIGGY
jgi:deoxyribose-phosphate aldolase